MGNDSSLNVSVYQEFLLERAEILKEYLTRNLFSLIILGIYSFLPAINLVFVIISFFFKEKGAS